MTDIAATGALHHLDLSVADPERSRAFYDLVLGALGYEVVTTYEDGSVDYGLGGRLYPSIGVVRAAPELKDREHRKGAPGFHHLALRVAERADVDRLHDLLVANAIPVLDAPAAYPQYGEGYYAVFFLDPDGLKLEVVFSDA